MLGLLIASGIAGTMFFWSKVMVAGWILRSCREFEVFGIKWLLWIPNFIEGTLVGAIMFDLGVASLAGSATSIASGTIAMFTMIWFGAWSIFYIKLRHWRRSYKRWWWKQKEAWS